MFEINDFLECDDDNDYDDDYCCCCLEHRPSQMTVILARIKKY